MQALRRHLGRALFTALVMLALALPAAAADIKAARVWAGPTHTRAVFDLSGPVDYKLFQLSQPDRVVLDFSDARLASGFSTPGGTGLLKDVRTGRHGKKGVRVVLDMKGAARPKSFLLRPSGKDGYRVVVDLFPDGAAAGVDKPAAPPMPLRGERKVVVCIDAGHGGKDPGSHGHGGLKEKTVTLAVAKDLKRLIDHTPGMTAVMTRTGDYFVPLKRRYQIAREHNADLFVSIHADAFRDADARGSSVWVLSSRGKSSEAARWLADRENRSDLIGGVSLDDKDDTLAAVLLDLQQGYAMQASSVVAGDVLHALAKIGPTHKGHVEHANFVVLRSPDVPSILVETAFITNPASERKLRSARHRELLAKAVLSGVKKYFTTQPPPGTWFAAQRDKRLGIRVASRAGATPADARIGDVHKVARGDTLSGIAHQYGVSINAIKRANRLSSDTLRTGTVLAIPTS